MIISTPVAIGEVVDKITILDIKLDRIKDEAKLPFLRDERAELEAALATNGLLTLLAGSAFYCRLKEVNEKIWDTEDSLRGLNIDSDTRALAISAQQNAYFNDERFRIKREINQHYGSAIREQKSHTTINSSN